MKKNRNDKKGKKGFVRILNAFFYSKDGIQAAWIDEAAFRQVFILAVLCAILAFFIVDTWLEYVVLILPCVISILIELLNSAIENAIDFVSLKTHPLAKKAKDMGSAAQLIALFFWFMVWGSFLWMRYF
ncbi:diacylglycerol kinase [Helicobacter sp. 12S02232-10]|uniref:diacylglycerol kinase n=1 Tax=Helicobacter sp. 12S02232-10 TaxID=1476197 RepID=UPI000BA60A1E|nr:diacylglycerol kinase [Helicobacter sp. 12S02232-10]PAF49241.1 diacylglycerol kinase [Helicobacter sp. 12S02232-10]